MKTVSTAQGPYHVIRTLDPNLWFSADPERRKNFLDELTRHNRLRIITALVVPNLSCEKLLVKSTILHGALRDLREWVQRYNMITRKEGHLDANFIASCFSQAEEDFQEAEKGFTHKDEV